MQGDWIRFRSSHWPLDVWLKVQGGGVLTVALSQLNVLNALNESGIPATGALPDGACAGQECNADFSALHHLMRRAFQLSRTLPDEFAQALLNTETAALPRSTEVERLVIQRVGQEIFRRGLLSTGTVAVRFRGWQSLVLRASHIKPWANCENDAERLDVFNGFLLAPDFDAVFDAGFITVWGTRRSGGLRDSR